MVRELGGDRRGEDLAVAVVVSRFNQSVTERLLDGALDAFRACGVKGERIDVVRVPGAFEIPLAVAQLAGTRRYDAIVCLGAVIRGETPHFEYIAAEVARGIGAVSRAERLPVVFGVLTTDTVEQALARAGGEHGNKGYEAATTAVEMARLLENIARRGQDKSAKKRAGGAASGPRRKGRELALQALFQADLLEDWSETALESLWGRAGERAACDFARSLFAGVAVNRERIDRAIASACEHWRIGRIGRVDAGILRLATYEILFCPEVPISAAINEAVEIAKRFGGSESSSFVNGVLDRIAAEAGRKEEKRGADGDG